MTRPIEPGSTSIGLSRVVTVAAARTLNFGAVPLNEAQRAGFHLMSRQLLDLCNALPAPLRSPALLTLQRHYAGFRLTGLMNFFHKFYVPAWSILMWLQERSPRLSSAEVEGALRGQALAMLLHMLDDHLSDGQLPVGPLLLQLRTEAWRQFTGFIAPLAAAVEDGPAVAQGLIDTYFVGVHEPSVPGDLREYRELSRKQLATGLVLPMLVAHRTGCEPAAVRDAYEAFGLAWRLLDDLRDCADDARQGQRSGLYFFLEPEHRGLWEACAGRGEDSAEWEALRQHLEERGVLARLVDSIHGALTEAAETSARIGLVGYATELRQLAEPFRPPPWPHKATSERASV